MKLFGPDQLYVTPAMKLAVKFNVPLTQIGPLLVKVAITGSGLTETVATIGAPKQPAADGVIV